MPSNRKPDVCFETNNAKSFAFLNDAYTLGLNEIRDKTLFRCTSRNVNAGTVLTIDSDRNSNKAFATYAVLNDITNIENITIAPADGVNLIWLDGDGTLETGKNYIIQFKQISQTTVLASLTNTTLTNKGEEPVPPPPPPPPPPPKEISAIYFAMPQSGTALYNTITWYNEKKGVWPAGATSHSEEMRLMIPQIINGEVVWKQFTNYTITDNMVKIPVEGVDEECFLNALNNNYKTFFILKLYYNGQIAGWQSIYVDYPIVWDYNITLGVYDNLMLTNATSYNQTMGVKRYRTYSNFTLKDANSNIIAKLYTHTTTLRNTYDWEEGNITLRSDGSILQSVDWISPLDSGATNTHFKRGFILDTIDGVSVETHVSIGGTGIFSFHAETAALVQSTNKPYMPFGNMELNYVKFEYKEVE